MKVLFINNTKNLENIGCQMTSAGLETLLGGHEVESFYAESVFKINQRLISSKAFKILSAPVNKFSRKYFYLVKEYILENKANLIESIDKNDAVLINGEGSIHHNRITGIVLIAIASIAKDRGKVVHLVNSTVQMLSPVQIREIKRLDRVAVRELYSKHFLLGHGIEAVLAADAAWVYLEEHFPNLKLIGQKENIGSRTLLTLGVAPNYDETKSQLERSGLEGSGVDYLVVGEADTKHLEQLKDVVAISAIINADAILRDPSMLTKHYGRVITGRHHIAILCYFLGTPVTTLPTNTYKIESTIFSLNGSTSREGVVMKTDEVEKAIRLAANNVVLS